MKKTLSKIINIFLNLMGGVLIGMIICTFLIQPLVVSGTSMSPTIENGSIGIILKFSKIKDFSHSDIVAINTPLRGVIVKRIIGTEGDVIEFNNDTGKVMRNGKLLEEQYLSDAMKTHCTGQSCFRVPKDSYFVMGDNRAVSLDSRSPKIGIIKKENILGKVAVV